MASVAVGGTVLVPCGDTGQRPAARATFAVGKVAGVAGDAEPAALSVADVHRARVAAAGARFEMEAGAAAAAVGQTVGPAHGKRAHASAPCARDAAGNVLAGLAARRAVGIAAVHRLELVAVPAARDAPPGIRALRLSLRGDRRVR